MSKVVFYDGGCADCQRVSAFLSANGVDYDRKNVKAHPELTQELEAKGTRSLPAIVVGDQVVTGWNETKLKNLLAL